MLAILLAVIPLVGCRRAGSKLARERFAYCPATTQRVAFLTEMAWLSQLGRSAVGFPAALKLEPFLTSAGLRPTDLHEVLALSVEENSAFVLKIDDTARVVSRLKNSGLHVAVVNHHEVVMSSTGPASPDSGLWFWTAFDKNTLVFGQRRTVTQMIEVAERLRPGLFTQQAELQHLLASAVDAELAVYSFTTSPSPTAASPTSDATNASVWGCRRSERTALFFVFFETHSRTAALVMANFGNFISRFQSTHALDGQVLPDRLACDQEGSLVRAYGFVDRSFADKAFSAAETLDRFGPSF